MVLWKKKYGTIPRTMELRFTKEKKHCRLPKTKNQKKTPKEL